LFDFSNGFNAGSESYGKGIPFISTLDVLNFSHLRCENIIGKVLLEKGQETYLVKKGDILFTRTSETQEEVGLTSVYMDEKPVTFGGFIIRGRQKKSCFDECYLGFAFKNSLVRKQIISLGQGGIHVNIGQTELQKVYIPIPPISEQKP
jgi:type I restriction enzyme S subunit